MLQLSWRQVNAWRINQHCLTDRLLPENLIEAVKLTGGIQAQVMSAAEMAIGARVDSLSPQMVQDALWLDHTLIKTWAMRATLHLIAASDLPLYVAARSLTDIRNWPYYFSYYGIDRSILDKYLTIGREILSAVPMKRVEFAAAVSQRLKSPELYSLLVTKGWGTPLKPLAWHGDLCFGPNQGQNVTFVRPSAWISEWSVIEPYAALQEVVRRYLHAFGPASVEDFTLWWGARLTPTRKLYKSLESELELVEIQGWHAFALKSDLESMQRSNSTRVVNLLPFFDAYMMGIGRGREIEPLIPMEFQKKVFQPQGWISAVILADGMIKGTWELEAKKNEAVVSIIMFNTEEDWIHDGIEAEAGRLGKFLNTNIVLKIETVHP